VPDGHPSTAFARGVVTVAVIKMLIAMTAIVAIPARRPATAAEWLVERPARLAAFGFAGALLLLSGKRDARARLLGICFLLVGSIFSDVLVRVSAADATSITLLERVMALQVDAFIPYFFWQFVRQFPRPVEAGRIGSVIQLAIRVSLGSGVALFAANFLLGLGIGSTGVLSLLLPLSRWPTGSIYYPLLGGLTVVALAALVWRTKRGTVEERRRGQLLVAVLVAGTAPLLVWILVDTPYPALDASFDTVRWVMYPPLLATPFLTAYAIVAHKALDVRLVIRRALQYALARYSVIALAVVPVVLLLATVYQQRQARVAELVTTSSRLPLLIFALVGLLAIRRRGELLQRIDRRFFREQYDARRTLGKLIDRCRTVSNTASLADILRAEIDRALHLHGVHVLFLEPRARAFVAADASVRPLAADAVPAKLLERIGGAFDTDLERGSPASDFAEPTQRWILDAGTRLLLPIRDRGRRLIGLLALGEKRSELPFSREDRELLADVVGAAEMAIAYGNLQPDPELDLDADKRAVDCVRCGAVQQAEDVTCARCGGETVQSAVPRMVAGKFLIEQRLGAGGMGVVYRGMDIHLERLVAIKTLPYLTPGEAIRLQREARTMASFSHPNLALIFGAEVWQGQPLLVIEYLPGGTLADRLRRGPLGVRKAILLGIAMTAVLEAIHRAGVLHRDIKPSNIGFTADGIPKLLDFGLARLISSTAVISTRRPLLAARARRPWARLASEQLTARSVTDGVVRGTPLYMSPEAADGQSPDSSFDLWSLNVVLYEAIFGRHPFGENPADAETSSSRSSAEAMSGEHSSTPSPSVVEHFVRALSENRRERPSSAAELSGCLRSLVTT
jgi:hypothetical protein